jgi:TPR repeat protein
MCAIRFGRTKNTLGEKMSNAATLSLPQNCKWTMPARSPRIQIDSVGLLNRSINALFGMPNALRANGVCETGALGGILRKARRASREIVHERVFKAASIPVFKLEGARQRAGVLPRIWLSEVEFDAASGKSVGRRFCASYPNGADAHGARALALAEAQFADGIACGAQAAAQEHFHAAEILYLHAAGAGSAEAYARLGAMYVYDVCAGVYWSASLNSFAKHSAYEVKMKAHRAYSRASARGIAEAKWRLGDMILTGEVCEKNEQLAFNVYVGAFARAVGVSAQDALCVANSMSSAAVALSICEIPHDAGSAAVRIAECFERGCGVKQNLALALRWIEVAEAFLDKALEHGAWFYAAEVKHLNAVRSRICE